VKYLFKVEGYTLVPFGDEDLKAILKLPAGKEIALDISDARSVKQHRFFWRALQVVAENSREIMDGEGNIRSEFENADQVLQWVKMKTGRSKFIQIGKETFKIPDSISFQSMGQGKFQKLVDDAIPLLANYLGLDVEKFKNTYLTGAKV